MLFSEFYHCRETDVFIYVSDIAYSRQNKIHISYSSYCLVFLLWSSLLLALQSHWLLFLKKILVSTSELLHLLLPFSRMYFLKCPFNQCVCVFQRKKNMAFLNVSIYWIIICLENTAVSMTTILYSNIKLQILTLRAYIAHHTVTLYIYISIYLPVCLSVASKRPEKPKPGNLIGT